MGFPKAYGDAGCQIHYWIAKMASTASAWVLMAISVQRFVAIIVRPLSFSNGEKWKTALIVLAIWIISGRE